MEHEHEVLRKKIVMGFGPGGHPPKGVKAFCTGTRLFRTPEGDLPESRRAVINGLLRESEGGDLEVDNNDDDEDMEEMRARVRASFVEMLKNIPSATFDKFVEWLYRGVERDIETGVVKRPEEFRALLLGEDHVARARELQLIAAKAAQERPPRWMAALDCTRKAVAELRAARLDVRRELGWALLWLARHLRDDGKPDECLQTTREALEQFEQLGEAELDGKAEAWRDLATLHSICGREEEALEALRSVADCRRGQVRVQPEHRPRFTAALEELVQLFEGRRLVEDALKAREESVDVYLMQRNANPDLTVSRDWLGAAYLHQSKLLEDLGRSEEALHSTTAAEAEYQHLHEELPEDYRGAYAHAITCRANLLESLGKRDEAVKAARRKVAILRPCRPDLASANAELAERLVRADQVKDAIDVRREALDLYVGLMDNPHAYLVEYLKQVHAIMIDLLGLELSKEAREAGQACLVVLESMPRTGRPVDALAQAATSLRNLLATLGLPVMALEQIVQMQGQMSPSRDAGGNESGASP